MKTLCTAVSSWVAVATVAVAILTSPNPCFAASVAEDYNFSERCGKRAQEVFDKSNSTPVEKDENGH